MIQWNWWWQWHEDNINHNNNDKDDIINVVLDDSHFVDGDEEKEEEDFGDACLSLNLSVHSLDGVLSDYVEARGGMDTIKGMKTI